MRFISMTPFFPKPGTDLPCAMARLMGRAVSAAAGMPLRRARRSIMGFPPIWDCDGLVALLDMSATWPNTHRHAFNAIYPDVRSGGQHLVQQLRPNRRSLRARFKRVNAQSATTRYGAGP